MGWRQLGHPVALVTQAATRERRLGVWQPRFWEHAIVDEQDYLNHFDYIHYNPVKHRYASCPHDWHWSSFHRYVRCGVYDQHWCCGGRDRKQVERLESLEASGGE